MSGLVWSPEYSVGIAKIDEQHRRFIEILNRFNSALEKGQGRDIVDSIITELENYASYHFRTEEGLFQRYGYPGYEEHKQEHEQFKRRVNEYSPKAQGSKSDKLIATAEVSNFMTSWLINHILKSDKKYTSYLNSNGVH